MEVLTPKFCQSFPQKIYIFSVKNYWQMFCYLKFHLCKRKTMWKFGTVAHLCYSVAYSNTFNFVYAIHEEPIH